MAGAALPSLSVVIPALDAAASLQATLASLGDIGEIIVVDGGSRDDTVALAERSGARVVRAERGRGRQLAAGAAVARGDWLLFLHADTRLQSGWLPEVQATIADQANRMRAAVFRFGLDDAAPQARRLERLVALRCALFALPYGDQGLLIHRAFYDALGGFRPIPLMEDVDMVRRIGRRRLILLQSTALTSAARWRRDGWLRRSARNLTCLTLFGLGVPAARIARIYGR
jgi:rSAM/selenodomain-associated transferase 2